MSVIKQKINDYIDRNKDELIKTIQESIKIQSLTGKEQEMQKFMKRKYEEIGLKIIEFEPSYEKVSKHEAFCDSGIPFQGRKNVIGIHERSKDHMSLTLHGHVDVVSAEPLEKWNKNPYAGDIEGNKLYGRGAADMKAGLLANWFALKTLIDLGIEIKGTVQLHSVIEEESGGAGGALACLEEGYVTDGYLTTEPHNLNVTIAHAGVLYFKVEVLGKSAHAGLAHEGVNAISKMYKIYNALEELDKKRSEEVHFDLFAKGSGQSVHLNRGTLRAGDWVSNVPGVATLECRIGFIPGETREDIKKLIHDTIEKACTGDEWLMENKPKTTWFGWTAEPWYQDPKDPYVVSFKETANSVLDKEVELIGRASGNDARFTQYYNSAGIAFGPKGYNIHGPDEYVEIDSVVKVVKVLSNHIIDWTSQKKE